jgi:hypothetical protein
MSLKFGRKAVTILSSLYLRIQKEGICFYCKEVGHIAINIYIYGPSIGYSYRILMKRVKRHVRSLHARLACLFIHCI